jgi:serine/threonine protein kinase
MMFIEYLRSKGKLEESEARQIFSQMLDTVHYCHNKGIIHRDIKLDNIVFADSSRKKIKIIDFGVSGIFRGEKSKAGSLQYMAPEVLSGWNIESLPGIDVWSLGCILYELLSGEALFQGQKEDVKVHNININNKIGENTSRKIYHPREHVI